MSELILFAIYLAGFVAGFVVAIIMEKP